VVRGTVDTHTKGDRREKQNMYESLHTSFNLQSVMCNVCTPLPWYFRDVCGLVVYAYLLLLASPKLQYRQVSRTYQVCIRTKPSQ